MIAREISNLLANRAEDVASMLLPRGKRKGSEWCVGSIGGEEGQSLKVCLRGSKSGVWVDFATGEGGDLLDLWALKNNLSIGQAIRECKQYLGLRDRQQQKTLYTTPKKDTYYTKPKKLAELTQHSTGFNYLVNERGLTAETIAAFRIQQSGSDDLVFPYYVDNNVVFIKYLKTERENGKKTMWIEKNCKPVLFGWQAVPHSARAITLCEGEIDAMSLHQCGIPALSVPFGGGSGRKHDWIENEYEDLEIFDEIYLCFDSDEAGQTATREIAERLGAHRCRAVVLPMKDANECLQNGFGKDDLRFFFDDAKSFDPEELIDSKSFENECWDYGHPKPGEFVGYVPAWDKTADKVLFRKNELSLWSGMNGHGKTQFLSQIILQMIGQGARVCIASMEFKPAALLHRMTRQATAMNDCSREQHAAVFEWFHKKIWLFDLQGTAKAQRLLEVFLYARRRYGIDVFVIDSFTTLDFAEDDYKGQKAFIEQLRDFKNQHNCQIHLVAHPRKGADESEIIGKYDIRGTAAVSDLADNCFSVWRNKAKEDALEKRRCNILLTDKERSLLDMPDCIWRCDKQRHGNWEGKVGFWFDEPSLQYLESRTSRPRPYLEH